MNVVKKFGKWNLFILLLVVVVIFCMNFFEDSHIRQTLNESEKFTEKFMFFLKNKDFQKLYAVVENNNPVNIEMFENDTNLFYNKYGAIKSFKYSGYNLSKSHEDDGYSTLYIHYIMEAAEKAYQCTFSIELFQHNSSNNSLKIKDFTVIGKEATKEEFFYIKLL